MQHGKCEKILLNLIAKQLICVQYLFSRTFTKINKAITHKIRTKIGQKCQKNCKS